MRTWWVFWNKYTVYSSPASWSWMNPAFPHVAPRMRVNSKGYPPLHPSGCSALAFWNDVEYTKSNTPQISTLFSFNKYLLSTYYAPGTKIGTRIPRCLQEMCPHHHVVYSLEGKSDRKSTVKWTHHSRGWQTMEEDRILLRKGYRDSLSKELTFAKRPQWRQRHRSGKELGMFTKNTRNVSEVYQKGWWWN